MLCAVLQSVTVLQVGIVALRDPLGAVEETPAAAGNHSSAVAVAWAGRKGNKEGNSMRNRDQAERHMFVFERFFFFAVVASKLL